MLNSCKIKILYGIGLIFFSCAALALSAESTQVLKQEASIEPKRFLDSEKNLPWPHELDKDIQFWINVYTKVDAGSGYIHDAKYLDIVYGKIKFKKDINRKARNKLVKRHKKRIVRVLKNLAKGNRKNLSEEEKRILELWPKGVTNAELKEATERIRFQLGQATKFKEGIMRSGRWMEHITAMMQKHQVPDLLRLLPHVESSFIPYARSHVGAAGMWQFTRGTGRRFMKVNHVIDERLDPYIAAEAAAKLLRHNYDRVGAWPLAITAYNHGLRSMQRAADKFGKDSLVSILREYDGSRFGFASRNFYLSFLAAAYVHKNHHQFFGDLVIEPYRSPDIFRLPKYLSVNAFKDSSIDMEALRALNPALSDAIWRGEKYIPKNYAMRLPKGTITQVVNVDKAHWSNRQIPDLFHKVRRGESLSKIAERHKIRLSALKKANNIRNAHRIRIGQRLVLPGRVSKKRTVAKKVQSRKAVDGVYTVQRGDTVGTIARAFKLKPKDLMSWNKIKNVRQLQIGQSLQLKASQVDSIVQATDFAVALPKEKSAPVVIPESLTETVVPVDVEQLKETGEVANLDIVESAEKPVKKQHGDIYNYAVANDSTIEILPQETLGHYADWLGIYARELREINNMRRKSAVIVGSRLKLHFNKTSAKDFEAKRQAYHQNLQKNFYAKYKIQGETAYQIKNGDSLWLLAQRDYRVPIWLLQQYNPKIEIQKIRPGATVIFPLVVKR